MNDNAIFTSVEQALFVAFLMESLPATAKSQMQVLIDAAMMAAGIVQKHERGTVNFRGLSPLEIRGQCAMIRGAVDHHLPDPERDSVLAKYGFQLTKAAGVRGMRNYAQALLTLGGADATLAMAWGVFGTTTQRRDFTPTKIATHFEAPLRTVQRDMQRLRDTGRILHSRAVDRLQPRFAGMLGYDQHAEKVAA